jgi:hypothetical protein
MQYSSTGGVLVFFEDAEGFTREVGAVDCFPVRNDWEKMIGFKPCPHPFFQNLRVALNNIKIL